MEHCQDSHILLDIFLAFYAGDKIYEGLCLAFVFVLFQYERNDGINTKAEVKLFMFSEQHLI